MIEIGNLKCYATIRPLKPKEFQVMDTMSPPRSKPACKFAVPQSRWDDQAAASMSAEELLLHRSNLLGSDLTVTNFGGGNTSAKLEETDPLSDAPVEVLWVKGSGGDLGSMKLAGFATLYQSKLLEIETHYNGPQDDDKMVGYLPHCTFDLNPRAASIDTPLHSLLPFKHIDHVHPDAIISLRGFMGRENRLAAMEAPRLCPRGHDPRLCARQSERARCDARRPRHHLLGRYRQRLL